MRVYTDSIHQLQSKDKIHHYIRQIASLYTKHTQAQDDHTQTVDDNTTIAAARNREQSKHEEHQAFPSRLFPPISSLRAEKGERGGVANRALPNEGEKSPFPIPF